MPVRAEIFQSFFRNLDAELPLWGMSIQREHGPAYQTAALLLPPCPTKTLQATDLQNGAERSGGFSSLLLLLLLFLSLLWGQSEAWHHSSGINPSENCPLSEQASSPSSREEKGGRTSPFCWTEAIVLQVASDQATDISRGEKRIRGP